MLIAIVALTGALAVLGFLFYKIAGQEQTAAEYFADSHKRPAAVNDTDALFDFVLRQMILGPRFSEYQSTLWGGDKSLLPTMFGRDIQAYNGQGVHLSWNGSSAVVDQDYDLTTAEADTLLDINVSPPMYAPGTVIAAYPDLATYPDPDVDHTSFDRNDPYLCFDAELPHGIDPDDGTPVRTLLPSFHRPQYLRDIQPDVTQWYTDVNTAARVLRPHQEHRAVTSAGIVTSEYRFVSTAHPDTAAGTPLNPFPFAITDEGLWNPADVTETFELDANPDGAGTALINRDEAVYIDVGFPILEKSDGTKYVVLAAVKLIDADGLINLNTAGNAAGNLNLAAAEFGSGAFLSRSNQAVGASEVNPQWGLWAVPPTGQPELDQHEFYLGHEPANILELSNLEYWWLLTSRPEFSSTAPVPASSSDIDSKIAGRWGELDRLEAAIDQRVASYFAWPGLTGSDDNNNSLEGGRFSSLPPMASLVYQAPMQPLDLRGAGSYVLAGTFGKQPDFVSFGRNNWPRLTNYFVHQDYLSNPAATYALLDDAVYSGALMPGKASGQIVDDSPETIIEPALAQYQEEDSIFGPSENAGLHLTQTDISNTSTSGRVRKLAPINFVNDTAMLSGNTPKEQVIRSQFTATSWDLKSFGKTFFFGQTDSRFRMWEFNADADNDSLADFPPAFSGAAAMSATDPFRAELRELLFLEPVDQTQKKPMGRLSINGVLDYAPSGRLRFRPLTPHPTLAEWTSATATSNDVVSTQLSAAYLANPRPETIANRFDQEALARRDRQKMARDIYVLLYTFGGGDDSLNYSDSVTLNPHAGADGLTHEERVQEMAQFAVNLVDRLDPDDVISAFEYPTNISFGWGLDDDPFTIDAGDRAVVYGIEEQMLSVNEAHAIFARLYKEGGVAQNHQATEWDDTLNRDYLYVELANVSPRPVSFANESWQIVVNPDPNGTLVGLGAAAEERRLTLTSTAPQVGTGATSLYSIGTAGDDENIDNSSGMDEVRPSHFMVDWDYQSQTDGMERIVPTGNLNTVPTDPPTMLSVDLIKEQHQTMYRVSKAAGVGDGETITISVEDPPGGDLLHLGILPSDDTITPDPLQQVRIDVRRRLNPNRVPPTPNNGSNVVVHEAQLEDNPWMTVDTLQTTLRMFSFTDTTNSEMEIQSFLDTLRSDERKTPLFGEPLTGEQTSSANAEHQANSIGTDNVAAAISRLWQPHGNREFASVIELFDLPLFGPDDLTQQLGYSPDGTNVVPAELANVGTETRIAADRFLYPGGLTGATPTDNRWYRVLELLEVPSRAHRQNESPWYTIDVGGVGDTQLGFFRVPGRLNLNSIRHPAVLAGLIDDPAVLDFLPNSNPWGTSPMFRFLTPDDTSDANRDWWVQFVASRFGNDPVTGLFLPGLPTSRPFRNMGFSQNGINSLEDTVLRSLPLDADAVAGRRLFEAGTQADHSGEAVDPYTRHRLLSKVVNNSTTRSNVFLAFIQLDYFEAKEVDSGLGDGSTVVRVGGKLADSPAHRGFFVIDRSKALDLVQPTHLPQVDAATGKFIFSFSDTFNYKSLILHRQRIN